MPCPSPGDLPDPGIEHMSPVLQEDSVLSEPPEELCLIDSLITRQVSEKNFWNVTHLTGSLDLASQRLGLELTFRELSFQPYLQ